MTDRSTLPPRCALWQICIRGCPAANGMGPCKRQTDAIKRMGKEHSE